MRNNDGGAGLTIDQAVTDAFLEALTPAAATLETTYNLESLADVKLDGRENGFIKQMLPGELMTLEMSFEVKDKVEPLAVLIRTDHTQGCSRQERLPVTHPQARILIEAIQDSK